MEDDRIIELYWRREETAITETDKKYGRYCFAIARNILWSEEDAKECVNDTYVGAWNAMPPHRPTFLSAFLGKITRRLSLKRLRGALAGKRGGGETAASFEELEECIPAEKGIDEWIETTVLTGILNEFLDTLTDNERRVFLRRYWYFDSVKTIAAGFGYSESKVKMMLKRTRDKLKDRLCEEEIWV